MIVLSASIVVIFLGTVLLAVLLVAGMVRLISLNTVASEPGENLPLVSVIIPVRNEAAALPATLQRVMAQNYPRLDVLVIDDRSEDDTPAILAQMQLRWPALRVQRIDALPDGWLGKSNAMQTGADAARGDFLLFIDGDVRLEETTISRAVNFCLERQADHLTLLFKNCSPGWLLNSLILEMGIGMLLLFRPWAVSDPGSHAFIGIGAFNLVRRDVYRAIEGHRSFRMHPIDDLMLGKAIKSNGYRQFCLRGHDFLAVPWYQSVGEMARGLSKNMFSLVHYNFLPAAAFVISVFLLNTVPLVGLFLTGTWLQLLSAIAIGLRLFVFGRGLVMLRLPLYYVPTALITPYLSSSLLAYAVITTIRQGGIYWRGTYYPLSELRKSQSVWLGR